LIDNSEVITMPNSYNYTRIYKKLNSANSEEQRVVCVQSHLEDKGHGCPYRKLAYCWK